ncbi:MAG: hypothetical protein ACE5NM_05220 [Sedimentisphaerales bacterium]
MRLWRTKFIFLLIVYFAGFASAIYTLAPVPESQVYQLHEKGLVYSALKSDEFAKSFNQGMHKCIDFGKQAVWRAGEFINQKLKDRQPQTGG